MSFQQSRGLLLAFALVCAGAALWASDPGAGAGSAPNLSSVQVVEQMHRHTAVRIQELKHYKALRHYQVEYKGYATTLGAKMDV